MPRHGKTSKAVSKRVPVHHPYHDSFEKFWDLTPSFYRHMFRPFENLHDFYRHPKKHTIYIDVGKGYQPEDISAVVEDGKLLVTGKAQERDMHGTSLHEFSRKYDLPKDIDVDSMTTQLDYYGGLRISFDRIHPERIPDLENLSTPDQYHVKLKVEGFSPDDVSVTTQGKDLIVEASHHKEETSQDGRSHYREANQYRRKMYMGDDVVEGTLQANYTKSGELEITAKRDASKTITMPHKLAIEHEKREHSPRC